MFELFVYGIGLVTDIYGCVSKTVSARFRRRFRRIARLQLGGSGSVDPRPLLRGKEYKSYFLRTSPLRNTGAEICIRFCDLDLSMLRHRPKQNGGPTCSVMIKFAGVPMMFTWKRMTCQSIVHRKEYTLTMNNRSPYK